MEKKHYYLTTTLPYVNADPHIGHAFEFVQADAYARYLRLMGHEVFFNTGTDEHGQKIARKADEVGESRQAYVDHYAARFKESLQLLNLSYDQFIRTTSEHHKLAAQEIWKRCAANINENGESDIYKKKYKGLYCVGCEAFKKESDLVDGKCPEHLKEPEEIEEENYFFRLSRYEAFIREYLGDETRTLPDWRRKELLHFVEGGLEDLSISREKVRMDWGIPVPGDEAHVMYVWFDALTNYISTLGWPEDTEGKFKNFWVEGETIQFAGKDQLRFQSVIWQAMLKSAGLPGTKKIVYHGFINSDGQKMSKSLGNVISPFELIEKYGTDATRYLLLRHVHPFEDTDITWARLDEWYTANLVNGLGNLASRIMKMAETHLSAPLTEENMQFDIADEQYDSFRNEVEAYNIASALNIIWAKHIQTLDLFIQENVPFKKIKSENENEANEAREHMGILVFKLAEIAWLLRFCMPETAEKIQQAVRANKKPENLFPRLG